MSTSVAIVMCTRDCPRPYLKHWLEYHLSIGATHIYLYDNESIDLVEPFDDNRITLKRWEGAHAQTAIYQDALQIIKNEGLYEWVAFIDDDEYIIIPDYTLPEFLYCCVPPFAAGVTLSWKNFGSSGIEETLSDGDVFKSFSYCLSKTDQFNYFVKTISRVNQIFTVFNPHFCLYNGNSLPVSTDWKIKAIGERSNEVFYDKAWVNHYFTRTKEDFAVKINRGTGDKTEKNYYTWEKFDSINKRCTEIYSGQKGKIII